MILLAVQHKFGVLLVAKLDNLVVDLLVDMLSALVFVAGIPFDACFWIRFIRISNLSQLVSSLHRISKILTRQCYNNG